MMYDKCSICGKNEIWVASVVKPGGHGEIYDALCRDCYKMIREGRDKIIEEIKHERKYGWLKKIVNLPGVNNGNNISNTTT